MQSHIRKVYACLAVTCHLHFWQNDRDLLRATAVTLGWNRYRNKSENRKLTPEKKIPPPLQQGFEPVTFQSGVRLSNHWAIPAPSALYVPQTCLSSSFIFPRSLETLSNMCHIQWNWGLYFDLINCICPFVVGWAVNINQCVHQNYFSLNLVTLKMRDIHIMQARLW